MKILKFGGSSVGSAERIEQVIKIIKKFNSEEENFSVVFSAFQGVTNNLIKLVEAASKNDSSYLGIFQNLRLQHINVSKSLLGNDSESANFLIAELLDELQEIINSIRILKYSTPRILDSVLSFGERLSNTIISEAFRKNNIDCEYLDASKLIITDSNFGHAKVNFELTNKNINDYYARNNKLQVITGFISSNENGEITTLGRGGSDYTASIFGAALNANEIQIWTDVNGIMTADPRRVSSAIPLKAVTYQEAMEMSYFGAKVIHPPTMQPAFEKKIRIRIKNTFEPEFNGTVIRARESKVQFNAKGISSIDDVCMFRIEGSAMLSGNQLTARIFEKFSLSKIPVLFISQGSSGFSICVAIYPDDLEKAKSVLNSELRIELIDGVIEEPVIEENLALLAVVGEDMRHTPGISGRIFNSLGVNGINIKAIAQGSSELNVSFIIKNENLKKALNVVHNSMFLSNSKVTNIFLAGPGLVGSALLDYFREKVDFLANQYSSKIRVLGITNSKGIIYSTKGINLENWREELKNSKEESNPQKFVEDIIEMNRANSIFVDCTAKEIYIPFYKKLLSNSIPIVTPNKIANTGSYERFIDLKQTAKKHNTQFFYSTNVGAAMPVINTLKDLVKSGENILKIEAILSGSLSFIFNSFKEMKKFSNIVREAKNLGYTEPDPRDDLSGLDTARKLLILIRECGFNLEMEDIKIENLVPEEVRNEGNIEEFFTILEKYDALFSSKKYEAEKNGNKLKYIASFENNKANVGLKVISADHPFYYLNGTENIVSFTTDNHDLPLVLKGKGAGAKYTAFGVFSDIIKIQNYLGL